MQKKTIILIFISLFLLIAVNLNAKDPSSTQYDQLVKALRVLNSKIKRAEASNQSQREELESLNKEMDSLKSVPTGQTNDVVTAQTDNTSIYIYIFLLVAVSVYLIIYSQKISAKLQQLNIEMDSSVKNSTSRIKEQVGVLTVKLRDEAKVSKSELLTFMTEELAQFKSKSAETASCELVEIKKYIGQVEEQKNKIENDLNEHCTKQIKELNDSSVSLTVDAKQHIETAQNDLKETHESFKSDCVRLNQELDDKGQVLGTQVTQLIEIHKNESLSTLEQSVISSLELLEQSAKETTERITEEIKISEASYVAKLELSSKIAIEKLDDNVAKLELSSKTAIGKLNDKDKQIINTIDEQIGQLDQHGEVVIETITKLGPKLQDKLRQQVNEAQQMIVDQQAIAISQFAETCAIAKSSDHSQPISNTSNKNNLNQLDMFDYLDEQDQETSAIASSPIIDQSTELTGETSLESTPDSTIELTTETSLELSAEPAIELTAKLSLELTAEPAIGLTTERSLELTTEPEIELNGELSQIDSGIEPDLITELDKTSSIEPQTIVAKPAIEILPVKTKQQQNQQQQKKKKKRKNNYPRRSAFDNNLSFASALDSALGQVDTSFELENELPK